MVVFLVNKQIVSIIKSEKYSIYNEIYKGYELIIDYMDFSKGDILQQR